MADPIKVIRGKLRGTTQTALARELGISVSFLNDILQGRRTPQGPLLAKLGLELLPPRYRRIREDRAGD